MAYGLVLLIPVFLWIISNPLLAGGVVALIAGTYTLARVGARVVRVRPWMRSVCVPGTEICIGVRP
jgi:hypothetical protein